MSKRGSEVGAEEYIPEIDPLDVIAASMGGRSGGDVVALEGEDIEAMARSGVPHLMNRAYILAMGSMDLKSVLSVLKEFADRGHGKVSDNLKVDMTVGIGAILKEIEGSASGLPSKRDLEYLDVLEGEDIIMPEDTREVIDVETEIDPAIIPVDDTLDDDVL